MSANVDLKQLSKDITSNLVFTSFMINPHDNHLLGSIFMPLSFLDEQQRKEMVDRNVYVIYEYYSESLPRSINGYPTFASFRSLSKDESMVVSDYCKKIQEALNTI